MAAVRREYPDLVRPGVGHDEGLVGETSGVCRLEELVARGVARLGEVNGRDGINRPALPLSPRNIPREE